MLISGFLIEYLGYGARKLCMVSAIGYFCIFIATTAWFIIYWKIREHKKLEEVK